MLYATDTYYIKYKFSKLNYLLIECNYILEIVKENINNSTINKSRYTRLLESHFSLENLMSFLKSNDLSNTKNIVLCHLSDTNSNQYIMQKTVQELTGVQTTVAEQGLQMELKLYPF